MGFSMLWTGHLQAETDPGSVCLGQHPENEFQQEHPDPDECWQQPAA